MIKPRTTQQFKDAIIEARRVFGTESNSCTDISKRALKWFKSINIDIPKLNETGIGSPTTIRVETELNNKDVQMVVIMYVNEQIEKHFSRFKKPLQLDRCDVYEIKEGESMSNCGTCQYSEIRPQGFGLCHNQDSDKYAEDVDYHDKECECFESLNQMFNLESGLWD